MLVGDGAACVDGSFIAGVIRGYGALSDGVLDLFAVSVLGDALPGVGPLVAVLGDGGLGGLIAFRHAVEGEGEGLGPDFVAVAVVVPGLGHGHVSRFDLVLVGDGAVVLGRAAFGVVTVDRRLFNGILDLLTVSVPIQAGPLHCVGVVFVIGHRQLGSVSARDVVAVGLQDQIRLKFIRRRPLAVLVVVVFPDLGDLDIGETVGVGVGNSVVGVRGFDRAGGRLGAFEGAVLPVSQNGTDKGVVRRERALGDGVGGFGGEVEETEVVVGLQLQTDIRAAGRVVVAGITSVFRTADAFYLILGQVSAFPAVRNHASF